jgi:hypothetical protein
MKFVEAVIILIFIPTSPDLVDFLFKTLCSGGNFISSSRRKF